MSGPDAGGGAAAHGLLPTARRGPGPRAGDAGPTGLVVDLSGLAVHDGGAGLLAALGAEADQPLDQGVQPLAG